MPVTVEYEQYSYKYRVKPSSSSKRRYYVAYQTFVVGFSAKIYDELLGDLWAHLLPTGTLFVYEGAPWDGPSGPALDSECFMDASLAHDYLYLMMEKGVLPQSERGRADKTMRALAKNHGMGFFRRMWTYAAVRVGGASHAQLVDKTIATTPQISDGKIH